VLLLNVDCGNVITKVKYGKARQGNAQIIQMGQRRLSMSATMEITERSMEVFLEYAKDAGNWGGNPLVGGNVFTGEAEARETRGNLTQLKRAGLITTETEPRTSTGPITTWIYFTEAGKVLAAEYGIEINN
jgi:hypothetical protein